MIIYGNPQRTPTKRSRLGLLPIAAALACMACIERSNPFDPLNAGPHAASDIRVSNRPRLDTLTAGEAAFAAQITGFAGSFSADSLANDGRGKGNLVKRSANSARIEANAAVASDNQGAAPEFLALKERYSLLDTLKAYGPYGDFQANRNALQVQAATLLGFMSRINAENAPTVAYPKAYSDSVFAPFARDTLAFFRLQARIDSGNAAVADSNLAITAYNAHRIEDNAAVGTYNDSIVFLKQTKDKNVITRPDSLQGITFVAKAGDSLLIGAGVFPVDLRFTNSGTRDSLIVVRGYPGMRTIFTPLVDKSTGKPSTSTLILSGRSHIRFEDIVFRGGGISGAKLENGCRNVSFRRCTFDSSGQFGLEVVDSEVELLDCKLLANGKGARLQGDVRLENVLIARNKGHGLEAVSPLGAILNCTVADNGGEGIRVNSPRRAFTIANTIVSGNAGYGIFREAENGFQDQFQVKECDVWGQPKDRDWGLQALDSARAAALVNSNLNIDPEYIDAPLFLYAPKPGSVLAGYEKQALPIIIGWRP